MFDATKEHYTINRDMCAAKKYRAELHGNMTLDYINALKKQKEDHINRTTNEVQYIKDVILKEQITQCERAKPKWLYESVLARERDLAREREKRRKLCLFKKSDPC